MADKASLTFLRLGDLQVPGNDLGVCVREDFISFGMLVFLGPNIKFILPDAKFVTRRTVSVAVARTTRGSAHIAVEIIRMGLVRGFWLRVFGE